MLVVVLTRWGSDYLPVQDSAVMDLRVRDVWSSDIPLTGAYSRYGWSHPGPLMYWLIAPFSLLFGKAAWATLVGAAVLQGIAIVWTARLAWRHGGLPVLALWLGIGTLAYTALSSSAWLEPWNPHLAFPFFTLFLLQSWLAWRGDARRLVGAVVVGSFVVQTHVGYAALVALVLVGAVVMLAVDTHRAQQRLRDLPAVRWSFLALVVLWLPVLVEPVVRSPGNLGEVARFFLNGGTDESAVGLFDALGLLAAEFRLPPPWLGGTDSVHPVTDAAEPTGVLWLIVPLAAVGAAMAAAWKRNDHTRIRAVALVIVVLVGAVATLSRIAGEPYPYLFHWRVVVAAFTVLLCAWTVVEVLGLETHRVVRGAWSGALATLVVAGSIGTTKDLVDHPSEVTPFETVTGEFVDELAGRGEPRGPTLVRFVGSALGGVHAGLVDELDRRGAPVYVDDGAPYAFGRERTAVPDGVDRLWYVVEDGHALSLLTDRPNAEVLVRTSPLSESQEIELVELQRRVVRQLRASGNESRIEVLSTTRVADTLAGLPGVELGDLRRIDALNAEVLARGTCRCAVISFPVTSPPQ